MKEVQKQQAKVIYKTMTYGSRQQQQEVRKKKYLTFTKYFGQQPKPTPTPTPTPTPQPAPQPAPVEPPKEEVVERPQEEAIEKPADFEVPVQKPEQPSSNQPSAGTWQEAILAKHNEIRARHNAEPLTWDSELEAFAQNHVNQCLFEHSRSTPFGENLAACTGEMKDPAGNIESGWYTNELEFYSQGDGFSVSIRPEE